MNSVNLRGSKSILVYIVEDHPVMRAALIDLVDDEDDMQVAGFAGSAEDVPDNFNGELPDVVMVDLSLPGASGYVLIERLRSAHPRLPTLIVSGHDAKLYQDRAMQAGANGYVMKDEPVLVLDALRRIAGGGTYPSDPNG